MQAGGVLLSSLRDALREFFIVAEFKWGYPYQGTPDYCINEPYCMILNEAVTMFDRGCAVTGIDTPGGVN